MKDTYQKLKLIHSAIEEAYNGKFRVIDDGFEEIPLHDNPQAYIYLFPVELTL